MDYNVFFDGECRRCTYAEIERKHPFITLSTNYFFFINKKESVDIFDSIFYNEVE